MPELQSPARTSAPTSYGIKTWYLFTYNLVQFCGSSWIFSNISVRFLTFGEDSLVDTYHSIGDVMGLCQLLSILELIHIAMGIDHSPFLPRFLQVSERNVILFVVITSQEELQSRNIVCVLFSLWSALDVFRYPYLMLSLITTDLHILSWIHHSLWIPLYPLAVMAEGIAIYQALPYFEALGTYSFQLAWPVGAVIHFPYILQLYIIILILGTYVSCQQFYEERKKLMRKCVVKIKQK
ncbi:very-long-chain (3R)-3-hydroxyacyl-CoA dehydratase 4 [Callorhinchus milii]|uniref:Very-long-chain (3R)-3-hydroxyacyl-CoA dehydratase n=2 Tax=Callorhinchus milii TaxID=7868 RepID=A0A4W3IE59_CALMI|nr:very-long-chain (3R)-3-hydroxyacyl-CoA dehydratase 4 [Callorhinchus milii]|eukprot:gi/632964029/ref/XP_007898199.1/ PREDICTED: very-long-chain (3R)-3-hydroxyacyl-[acyl-carrier protein] dehydratase 4 [Callorhinchus milii]